MSPTWATGSGLADDDDLSADLESTREVGPYAWEMTNRTASVLEWIRTMVDPSNVDPAQLGNRDAQEILAFCRHHDINADQAAEVAAPGSHEARAKRGLWQEILLNLRNFEEGDPQPPRKGRIPIAEIHVPAIAGCECTYAHESSRSSKIGLTVKIRGVGGGGGRGATVTFSQSVTSPSCAQVTIPGSYQVTPWTNPDSGDRVDLLSFVDLLPGSVGLRPISATREHPCSPGVAEELAKLSQEAGDVFATHALEIPGAVARPSQRVASSRSHWATFSR